MYLMKTKLQVLLLTLVFNHDCTHLWIYEKYLVWKVVGQQSVNPLMWKADGVGYLTMGLIYIVNALMWKANVTHFVRGCYDVFK